MVVSSFIHHLLVVPENSPHNYASKIIGAIWGDKYVIQDATQEVV
jgi:hypothetical protein